MPGYYTYLISSLPMLHFGTKPPFSFEKFLQICHGIISDSDISILKMASQTGEDVYESAQPTFPPEVPPEADQPRAGNQLRAGDMPLAERRWRVFNTALRNELVKVRAVRKRLDPLKYMRQDGYTDPSIAHIAISAQRDPSILEAERALDQERWRVLDELALGHYFDIDFLILYAHKLLILQRWGKIRTADKSRALEDVLQKS